MKVGISCLLLSVVIELASAMAIIENPDNGLPLCGIGTSKCYGKLGCVNYTSEWFSLFRPINLLPFDRDVLRTTFRLHTKNGPDDGELITADDPETIKNSRFNINDTIMFIVHGFTDNGDTPWLKEMAQTIIQFQGPTNVLRVNWGFGSLPPYICAVANTRLVGLEIGYFANVLINDFGAKPGNIHVIGHSLGAHIAGYAAEQIPGKQLGMVVGLDPAGPYFHKMPPVVRLDYTDAKFVQAIHTDSSPIWMVGLGMKDRSGHVDFYPNNGEHQPGCSVFDIPINEITNGMIPFFRKYIACSHIRSIELYQDTFVTGCPYVGYECSDYDTFKSGACFDCGENNTHCSEMGVTADDFASTGRKEVPMYFETGATASFSKYHYHVRVSLAKPSKAHDWLRGTLTLTIQGSLRTVSDMLITPSKVKFYHGETYDFLYVTDLNVGEVKSVDLEWDYKRDILDPICIAPFCCNHLFVSNMDASVLNHYPESELEKYTSHMIPSDGSTYADISSGDSKPFSKA